MTDDLKADDAAATPSAATPSAATPLRVLVVDDDGVDRLLVRRALGRSGLVLAIDDADTSIEAAERLTANAYDCILLDYNLPGNDGLSVLRGMKREHRGVPVVILTGQGDEEVAVELMKAGAADYLPKSGLTPLRLGQSVRAAIDLARAERAAARADAALRLSSERTARLQQITASLAAALSTREVAERFTGAVREATGAATVWLASTGDSARDGDGERLSAIAHAGHAEQAPPPLDEVPLDEPSLVTDVLHEGTPRFYASRAELAGAYADLATLLAGFDGEAMAALPLDAGRGAFGVCTLGFRTPRTFDEGERAYLVALVGQCAGALERAALYESERRSRASAERLAAQLAGAARAILHQPSLQGVLDEIARQARDVIAAHRAVVTVAPGQRTAQQSTASAVSERYSAWREFADAPPVRDRLLTPLLSSESVPLGTIEVLDKVDGTFTSADESILQQLAEVAAAAVENVRLRERAEFARRDAEAANRAKSEFLARMSHDLRTPLNAIGGHTSLLQLGVHGALSTDQRAALERVRLAQQHLLALINDILSFARLEAGQVRITSSPVAIGPLVEELAGLVRPEATARGLALTVHGDIGECRALADRERLIQVLLNLTSNALKFTETGEVRLIAEAHDDSIAIHVQDTGVGIPESRLDSIFEPFVQARGSVTERQGGVGLGLAISRELAERMGGAIAVDSVEGEGSTFTVRLQRVQDSA